LNYCFASYSSNLRHWCGQSARKQPVLSSAPRSRETAGIALALAAAVAFALANTSASVAYHGGSNPLTVAAMRFLLPTGALVVWLRMSGVPLRLPARDGWVAALLGAITAFYTLALLSAIGAIPLALAILVFYLFPLVATVTLAVCGWEKLGRQTLAAIVLAFAGLTLALNPHGGGLDLEGVALALVGALGLGIVIAVSSRVFRAGDSRPVTLYIAAVAAVVLIVLCAAHGELVLPQTGFGWLGLVGTSVFYAFAMIAFFIAISMIGPVRVSLLSYAEPVVAAGLGVTLLGEALALPQIAGIALVIAALVGATLWQPRKP
jgi:drug/metabolite transporter (DMT)-like permease